jgi:ParB-like chromosome segregation protein Spo0J
MTKPKVRQETPRMYRVLAGQGAHRVAAAKLAGYYGVECIVLDDPE